MKAAFFGTSNFAVPSLRLLATKSTLAGVITQPDRPAGRGHRLTASPVKEAALELGLTVYAPSKLVAFATELQALEADIFVVASYGRILPQVVLDLPRRRIAFNVHPSLLPLYRGATPLQTAIRDGRTQTGVTIIAMDAGMDSGDILVQRATAIGVSETYGELHDRLAVLGAELLGVAIDRFAAGKVERTPQAILGLPPNEIEATRTRPLTKEDMLVDWSWTAARIVNTIRSLAPLPAARVTLEGESTKVSAARQARAGERGVTADAGFVVLASDGVGVVILRVTPSNRGPLSGAAYARARGLQ